MIFFVFILDVFIGPQIIFLIIRNKWKTISLCLHFILYSYLQIGIWTWLISLLSYIHESGCCIILVCNLLISILMLILYMKSKMWVMHGTIYMSYRKTLKGLLIRNRLVIEKLFKINLKLWRFGV